LDFHDIVQHDRTRVKFTSAADSYQHGQKFLVVPEFGAPMAYFHSTKARKKSGGSSAAQGSTAKSQRLIKG